jgi:hypothetical protein
MKRRREKATNGFWNFFRRSHFERDYRSLDLRLELLRMSDPCSILRSGASHITMLIKANNQSFAEAADAVTGLPCLHRSEAICRPGYVEALAGSFLR